MEAMASRRPGRGRPIINTCGLRDRAVARSPRPLFSFAEYPTACCGELHSEQTRTVTWAVETHRKEMGHRIGKAWRSSGLRRHGCRLARGDAPACLTFNTLLVYLARKLAMHLTPVRPRRSGFTPWRAILCGPSPSSSSASPQKVRAAPTWLSCGGRPGSVAPSARPAAVGQPHDAF